jgi:GlcNAc-P-P-Und epimerase
LLNVLVTGGSGFIGTNLIEYYAQRGCGVLNVDISPPRNAAHHGYWVQSDICDKDRLRVFVEDFQPHLIMHMAARTDLQGRTLHDYRANVDGVKSIIDIASGLSSLKRVIFASSMLVCFLGYQPRGDEDYCPTTKYGESKVVGEKLVKSLASDRFAWTIVRPTSLWGPWFDVPYRSFFDAVAKGIYFHPKGRRIRRSYGFVLNAVHQIDRIATCNSPELVDRKIFYLADDTPIELFDWAEKIAASFDRMPVREVPLALLKVLAVAGDLLKRMGMRNPPMSSFRLNNLLTEAVFNIQPLKEIAGRSPYDVETAVRMTVEWIVTQHQ